MTGKQQLEVRLNKCRDELVKRGYVDFKFSINPLAEPDEEKLMTEVCEALEAVIEGRTTDIRLKIMPVDSPHWLEEKEKSAGVLVDENE